MYVADWANHDVRTEGMSYGMVQLENGSQTMSPHHCPSRL
jgi:hypothetical protein